MSGSDSDSAVGTADEKMRSPSCDEDAEEYTSVADLLLQMELLRMGGDDAGGSGGKEKWRRAVRNTLWEPELCVQLLKLPSTHNFSAVQKQIQTASKKWVVEFLERDGLGVLLESLEKLSSGGVTSLSDTISQFRCVSCIRALINSEHGLQYIAHHKEYTRQLTNVLNCPSNSVKLQVFELLCALCMFSSQGHALSLDALSYYKSCHGQRYRLDKIIDELNAADNVAYQTTLMAFVNCLILANKDITQRIRLRNELFGSGLSKVLSVLKESDDEGLRIQIKVFEKHQAADDDKMEPWSPHNLFDTLFKKIADTRHVLSLQFILFNLIEMCKEQDSDRVWEFLEEATSQGGRKRIGKNVRTKDSSTQTLGPGRRTHSAKKRQEVGVQVGTTQTDSPQQRSTRQERLPQEAPPPAPEASPPPPLHNAALHGSMPCLSQSSPLHTGHHRPAKYNTLPRPTRKMKTINWTKIPNQVIKDSLWGKVEAVTEVAVDYAQMDELFCQAPRPNSAPLMTGTGSGSGGAGGAPSGSSTPPAVHLLDSRRSLAVNILLKQYKAGPRAVLDAIASGTGLPPETLKSLTRLLPDRKELAMIMSHPCEREQLGSAERFYLDLSDIPEYALRIQAMLQKEEVPTVISELEPQLKSIIRESNNLMENSSLKQFMVLVLQLGNYLNTGSYAGNAAGFKLNTLPKLLETRANKPRVTFLHYVVDVAQSHRKDILGFTQSMNSLRQSARVPVSAIEEDINSLAAGVRKLEKQMTFVSEDIQRQFSDFITSALESVGKLEELLAEVKNVSKLLALHFCEDPDTFQLEECFTLFADFFEKTQKALQENEQRKKQELQAAKMEDEKLKSKIIKKKKQLPKEDECLVDLLMKEIRGGTFKLRRSTPFGQG